MTTIEKIGRRHYLRGAPYDARGELKDAGCKWDPEERAWWTSKADTAQRLIAHLASARRPQPMDDPPERKAPGERATVAGRAKYKGRTYYVAGRVERGRTQWDDRVSPITTRDGAKVLLYFRDGSKEFWAPLAKLTSDRIIVGQPLPLSEGAEIVSTYQKPKTIGGLLAFQRRIRENGGTHPDACPHCGSLSCSTAYGRDGLCDED